MGRERRGTGGEGRGGAPSGPALCPPELWRNGVFWADSGRLDLGGVSQRIGGVSQGNCPTHAKLPGLSGLQPRRDLRPPPPPARPSGAMRRVRASGSLAGVMTPDRGSQVP